MRRGQSIVLHSKGKRGLKGKLATQQPELLHPEAKGLLEYLTEAASHPGLDDMRLRRAADAANLRKSLIETFDALVEASAEQRAIELIQSLRKAREGNGDGKPQRR